MQIGDVMRAWRWREEYTVKEAAEKIGLTPSTFSRIERGLPMTDASMAKLLCWLLS